MDSRRVLPVAAGRRRRCLPVACLGTAVALAASLGSSSGGGLLGGPGAFSAPQGLSRKQQRSNLNTRANLPENLEVPLEEPEPEEPPKEPLPERRVPYTLHIVSHFPNNKHLHEESNARKAIEQKIVDSFENLEDMIRHVEVNLQVSENFHREKPQRHSSRSVSGSIEEGVEISEANPGARMLAPYIFKVTISLTNQRTIVLANAEKHAQPTLSEGLDHMVDVVRRSLREEKDKEIQARKKQKALGEMSVEDPLQSFDDIEADERAESIEQEADRKAEAMYRQIEESSD